MPFVNLLHLIARLFGALIIAAIMLSGQTVLAQENSDAKTPLQKTIEQPAAEPVVVTPKVDDVLSRAARNFEVLNKELEAARKSINSPTATIDNLIEVRGKLLDLRAKVVKARGELKTPIADFAARLKELGPTPKKGESEAESITRQRAEISKVSDNLKAALKQFDLLELESGQLASKTTELQKTAFVERVFVSRRSVLNPKLWWAFTPTLIDVGARSASVFQAWHKSPAEAGKISGTTSFILILAVFFTAILLVLFIWKKMANPPVPVGDSSDLRRMWRATGGTLLIAGIGFLAVIIGLTILNTSSVEDLRISRVVIAVGEIIFSTATMITVLRAVLAPSNALWRLANIDDQNARKLYRYGLVASLIFGLDRGAGALADITFLPLEFIVGVHALVSMLLIVILAKMVSTARRADVLLTNTELHSERSFYFGWASRFFLLIWLFLIAAIVALLFGYVALAHFILTNLLVTSAMVVMLYLIHHLVDALVSSSTQPWSRIGKTLRDKIGFGDESIRRLGLLLSTITDLSVIFLGAPLILALWTITWVDFSSLASQAFFGFKVGDVYIEPAKIALAISILIGGIIVVRILSLWLNRRILERSSIDSGVQNSIATGVKYTGILLVGGFALSAAGLDFSKLAIVAGALSVGIGFGLQSVVSNFVSGLILLAERPIRIGDWIEVGAGEGVVKKINVRSTEIETFDRCSVIVPNSSFITDPVKNWSHGSSVGRIKVNIGVGYNADPEKVQEILLKCAQEHERIIASPAPRVMFMDFGSSSLDFQLRIFLDDIGYCTAVASDLRFAMYRELKAAGIEIPFPQRDINIRNIDELSTALTKKPAASKTVKK